MTRTLATDIARIQLADEIADALADAGFKTLAHGLTALAPKLIAAYETLTARYWEEIAGDEEEADSADFYAMTDAVEPLGELLSDLMAAQVLDGEQLAQCQQWQLEPSDRTATRYSSASANDTAREIAEALEALRFKTYELTGTANANSRTDVANVFYDQIFPVFAELSRTLANI